MKNVTTYRYVGIMKIPNLHPGNVQLVRKQFRGVKIMLFKRSVVFRWLRNERSGKRFSHTWLRVWVQVSRGLCKVSVFVLPLAIA